MIAIRLAYSPGIFHEAPWIRSRHVLEWPPSPFLLLGAIIGGWARGTLGDVASLQRICDLLAGIPAYNLPPSSMGHAVHYGTVSGGAATRDLSPALDAFGRFSSGSQNFVNAYVIWPGVQLENDDAILLESILSNVRNLKGRACTFSLANTVPEHSDRIDVRPALVANGDGPIVRRLVARADIRGEALLKALLREATSALSQTRKVPAGAEFVDYRFPPQFGLDAQDLLARDRARADLPPRIERFAMRPMSGSRAPLVTETLAISEAMRWATMRASSARDLRAADPVLSGKAPSGRPSVGHGHAFFLPCDLDNDGRLDHVDIWYPTGSSVDTHRAAIAARLLYDHRLDGRFQLSHLGPVQAPSGSHWRSTTPFVLERHVKMAGRGSNVIKSGAPREQVLASLANHGVTAQPIDVIVSTNPTLIRASQGLTWSPGSFRRARLKESHAMPGYFVELIFDSVIEGPIVAGRHAHFGLGQFGPTS